VKKAVAAFTIGILLSVIAKATPIVYTFRGTSSGSVGATSFSNSAFMIQVFADTNDVVQLPQESTFTVEDISSTFEIAGIGLGVFSAEERVFDNQDVAFLGFARSVSRGGEDLLDFENIAFATYDLRNPFGPTFLGSPPVFVFNAEPSTLGPVTFTSFQDVTFSANVVSASDASSTVTLLLLALTATLGLKAMLPKPA
jgi:hypothetical protein